MAKRSPEEVLKAVADAPIDDEIERVLAMSPEERRAELEEAGVSPDELDAKADALYARMRVAQPAPVVHPRRRAWGAWLVAAAIATVVGLLAVTEGAAIVAWLERGHEEPIGPDKSLPRPPSPRELAEKARDEATAACDDARWVLCRDKLDEARRLDPGGESESRVQRMRGAIADGTSVKVGPKVGPEKK